MIKSENELSENKKNEQMPKSEGKSIHDETDEVDEELEITSTDDGTFVGCASDSSDNNDAKEEPNMSEGVIDEVDFIKEDQETDSGHETNTAEETPVHETDIQNIHNSLLEMKDTQKEIQNDFNTKLKYDEHKEKIIDKLHKELQEYKDDMIKSTMQPLVRDLFKVIDDTNKLVDIYRSSDDPVDSDKVLSDMESMTLDVDDALYRQGIDSFNSLGEKFDPMRQTIFKTVKTNDETLDRHIAKRLRKGYEWDGKVIRKETVSVYVYDKELEEIATENNEGADSNE